MQQKINMNIVQVGPEPSQITCPSCRATIVTRVERKSTTKTHVIALLLCLFLCWPCVCVPYCVDSCQNADHYCPNCNSYLVYFHKIARIDLEDYQAPISTQTPWLVRAKSRVRLANLHAASVAYMMHGQEQPLQEPPQQPPQGPQHY
ncbi:unnamed protein product [Spodoptera littoralis]|uniref:LITAF domain-containing protein n=1 Tax=Spodoptera littoralis TaxID=7109 RepID=A0A9P0MYJ0_SPOLI|nr:unnamed protein product [Spodoptera littoralis]CAH1635088.1 unnamed protein product [Spodoptera littoralis]